MSLTVTGPSDCYRDCDSGQWPRVAASTAVASNLAGVCDIMAGGAGAAGPSPDNQPPPAGDVQAKIMMMLLDCQCWAGLSPRDPRPRSGGRRHGRGRGLYGTSAVDPTSDARCRERCTVTRYMYIAASWFSSPVFKVYTCSAVVCSQAANSLHDSAEYLGF